MRCAFRLGATEAGPRYSGLLQIVRSRPVVVSSATAENFASAKRTRRRRRLSGNQLTLRKAPCAIRRGVPDGNGRIHNSPWFPARPARVTASLEPSGENLRIEEYSAERGMALAGIRIASPRRAGRGAIFQTARTRTSCHRDGLRPVRCSSSLVEAFRRKPPPPTGRSPIDSRWSVRPETTTVAHTIAMSG